MDGLLVFLFAYVLGFVASIPIGGSQIELAKRALHGRLFAARLVILGSVSCDTMWGSLALFGISPFLELPWVMLAFNIVGALVLLGLSYFTIKESKKPHELRLEELSLKSDGWSYFTGFSIAFSNPTMILTWLLGVTLAGRMGFPSPFSASMKALFVAGGALGLATYPNILALVIHRIKHFIPLKVVSRVYYWLGVTLFVLSFYFIFGVFKAYTSFMK